MQLHEIKIKNKLKKSKRIGRGGKRGASSGRGMKGQRSRSGRKFKPIIRELIKRYPKLKGYRQKLNDKNQDLKIVVLNLDILDKTFSAKEKITPESLLEKGIIRKRKGKMSQIKILSKGKITKTLIVENCQFSKTAREKIEKAGGEIKLGTKNEKPEAII